MILHIFPLSIFLLLLLPISFADSEYISINQINCPENLSVGERSKISFTMQNLQTQDIVITDMQILSNEALQNNNSKTEIRFDQNLKSFTLDASSKKPINGIVNFSIEGVHYIDLEIEFLISENPTAEKINYELCRVNSLPFEKEQIPFFLSGIIFPISTAITGIVGGYFIKRRFVNQDVKHTKSIEHQHWRLEQIHKFATKYYFPLAKESWEVERVIAIANQSKSNRDSRIAFEKLNRFLKRYIEFKKEIGATFLFVVREYEGPAIKKMQSILVSIPYDDTDIDNIIEYLDAEAPIDRQIQAKNELFVRFQSWLNSNYCERSRRLVLLRLREFGTILDTQAEIISHPDLLEKEHTLPESSINQESFWILHTSSKIIHCGETIVVHGNGFKNADTQYTFFLGSLELNPLAVKNNYIKLQIPQNIKNGSYDLSAGFVTNEKINFTIGIVIHVS